jgi:hypothetical protein
MALTRCELCQGAFGGRKKTGKNPTDRGKGAKRSILTEATGVPIGILVGPANRHDSQLLVDTIRSIPVHRPRPSRKKSQGMLLGQSLRRGLDPALAPKAWFYATCPRSRRREGRASKKEGIQGPALGRGADSQLVQPEAWGFDPLGEEAEKLRGHAPYRRCSHLLQVLQKIALGVIRIGS